METVTILDPYNKIRELEAKIDHVKDYIKDTYEMEDFVPSVLTDIANILDISLTKQYIVEANVFYRGNIEIPIDADPDELEDKLSFVFNIKDTDGWEIDLYEDEVEISCEDA